jgi:diguanylate cyclase (GGDEF)-like protein
VPVNRTTTSLSRLAWTVAATASVLLLLTVGAAYVLLTVPVAPVVGAAVLVVVGAVYFALAFRLREVLRTTARDIARVRAVLDRLGTVQHVSDMPPSGVADTGALAETVRRLAGRQETEHEQMVSKSLADPVTGLPYREAFFERLRHAHELARRGNPICLAALEVEHLDRALAVLGNESADNVMRLLAATLARHTRKSDFAARLGISSFALILYNAKGDLMRPHLEEIRRDFSARQQASPDTGGNIFCSLSLGLVTLDARGDQRAEDALHRANAALGAARHEDGIHLDVTPAAA